ncbi:hypothetical protein Dsin_014278 [Dipteronia sinensis]|uniref:Thaumatin-like protein n=1 Tax=Dipteronia sinensis TaxID=43782 RepID=A0AAE0AM07_9ROSI|nr:hypothetical protein Dsin_014278 [Dipteronia sinensis]
MNLISLKKIYFSSFIVNTLYLLLSLQSDSIHAATFTILNNCTYTVWAAAVPGGGRELKHGQDWVVNTDPNFGDHGRIWARTNCEFDANGIGKCETGDCNGALYCLPSVSGKTPYTLAQYTFRALKNDTDYFDISVVFGFNVPMEFRGTSSECSKVIKCVADINGFCPTELRHSGGCYHPCSVFNNKQFCCLETTHECPTTAYFKFFKDLCPNVYSYEYDDATAQFTCPTGTDYKVVFCPSST